MKLNKKLIEKLRNGEIAVENNGTVEQLRGVIKAAFPKNYYPHGGLIFYFKHYSSEDSWDCDDKTNLPIVSVSDFYQPELFTGWAKDDNDPKWMFYFKNDIPNFGFNTFGSWREGGNVNYSECQNNRPATHEEIESTLIKEAKRRGYKGGNTINGIHGTLHFPEEISFRYEKEGNRLVTDEYCVVFENGQWAEIVEQPSQVKPKTNPIKYLVDGIEYSLDYQNLKFRYEDICQYSDEQFMDNLPEIAHLACMVAYLKGLGVQATISDKGIIHELIHLMTEPNEPTNDLQEIREKFNRLIKLS